MEPPLKRPRFGQSHHFYEDSDELELTVEELEPDRQVDAARDRSKFTFKSRLEQIFECYERDFTDTGDEIDLRKGELVTDNGHMRSLFGTSALASLLSLLRTGQDDEFDRAEDVDGDDDDEGSGEEEHEGDGIDGEEEGAGHGEVASSCAERDDIQLQTISSSHTTTPPQSPFTPYPSALLISTERDSATFHRQPAMRSTSLQQIPGSFGTGSKFRRTGGRPAPYDALYLANETVNERWRVPELPQLPQLPVKTVTHRKSVALMRKALRTIASAAVGDEDSDDEIQMEASSEANSSRQKELSRCEESSAGNSTAPVPTKEPTVAGPAVEEPVVEAPPVDEAVIEESVVEEPVVEVPAASSQPEPPTNLSSAVPKRTSKKRKASDGGGGPSAVEEAAEAENIASRKNSDKRQARRTRGRPRRSAAKASSEQPKEAAPEPSVPADDASEVLQQDPPAPLSEPPPNMPSIVIYIVDERLRRLRMAEEKQSLQPERDDPTHQQEDATQQPQQLRPSAIETPTSPQKAAQPDTPVAKPPASPAAPLEHLVGASGIHLMAPASPANNVSPGTALVAEVIETFTRNILEPHCIHSDDEDGGGWVHKSSSMSTSQSLVMSQSTDRASAPSVAIPRAATTETSSLLSAPTPSAVEVEEGCPLPAAADPGQDADQFFIDGDDVEINIAEKDPSPDLSQSREDGAVEPVAQVSRPLRRSGRRSAVQEKETSVLEHERGIPSPAQTDSSPISSEPVQSTEPFLPIVSEIGSRRKSRKARKVRQRKSSPPTEAPGPSPAQTEAEAEAGAEPNPPSPVRVGPPVIVDLTITPPPRRASKTPRPSHPSPAGSLLDDSDEDELSIPLSSPSSSRASSVARSTTSWHSRRALSGSSSSSARRPLSLTQPKSGSGASSLLQQQQQQPLRKKTLRRRLFLTKLAAAVASSSTVSSAFRPTSTSTTPSLSSSLSRTSIGASAAASSSLSASVGRRSSLGTGINSIREASRRRSTGGGHFFPSTPRRTGGHKDFIPSTRSRLAASPVPSLVETPGGTKRRCGEDGFRCDRDLCFFCLDE